MNKANWTVVLTVGIPIGLSVVAATWDSDLSILWLTTKTGVIMTSAVFIAKITYVADKMQRRHGRRRRISARLSRQTPHQEE